MQYLSTITNFDNHTHCLRLGNFFGQNLIQISFALLMLKISRQVRKLVHFSDNLVFPFKK